MKYYFSQRDIQNMMIPLFWEQLLVILVGIADTFMISYAGDSAVSGVSLVNMFNTIFIYLFTALASGGAIIISQYLGNRDSNNASKAAGQLLFLSVLFSIGCCAVSLIWKERLLSFLFSSVEANVMNSCLIYLQITAFSFPALAMYNTGAAIFRSIGNTAIPMRISIISNILNIAGNYIGVFLLNAGVAGVAYPSLFSRIFSAIWITILAFQPQNELFYQWKSILHPDKHMLQRILNVSVPNGIENGLFQLVKVALSSMIALFGTVQIAANGTAQSIWSLAAILGMALSPVYITIIGRCMGAGDTEAAEYYFKQLIRIGLITSCIWNFFILLITPLMLRYYGGVQEVKNLVFQMVFLHNLCNTILFPISGPMSSGLRAAGDIKFTMYISLLSTIIIRISLSVFLGIYCNLGVIGITIAMCCDWGVRAIIFWIRFRSGKWKNFKVI